MPEPLDPSAPFQADGSGGVIDDTGVCDNLPRMVQGAALLGGLASCSTTMEATSTSVPRRILSHLLRGSSSQGFGCDGGVGTLVDQGSDQDRYREGPRGRINGATLVEPQTACFAAPGLGIFADDGPW
jgi:hypothetical protein